MTCPRCNVAMDRGRCQANGVVWCFECSLDQHDVEVRERKAAGTFVAPRGPVHIIFHRVGDWTAPPAERAKA